MRVLPIKLSAGYRSWNSAYRGSTGIVANEFIRLIHETKAAPQAEPHAAPIRDGSLYSDGFLVVRLVGSISGELLDGIVVGVNVTPNTTEKRDRNLQHGDKQVIRRLAYVTPIHACSQYTIWSP